MTSPQTHLNTAAARDEIRAHRRAAIVRALTIAAVAIVLAEMAHMAADTIHALPGIIAQSAAEGALK